MDGTLGKANLKEYIKTTRPIIQKFLATEIQKAGEIGELPKDLMIYFNDMVMEGKGIRGFLVYLGYLANGGTNISEIIDTSLFIEIFHSGILIHDDFMDRDNSRRGIETVHHKYAKIGEQIKVKTDPAHYGDCMAVNAGDVTLYVSWQKLLMSNFPKENIIRAAEIYCKYAIRLGYGQMLDVTIGANDEINEEDVLKVLWVKSGEYTSLLPLSVGAALANPINEKLSKAIESYAKCFGWAFQIQDDHLGMFGKEEEIGKPITSDLREGKNTLFMVHLRKLGAPEDLQYQKEILGKENVTKEEVYRMREILERTGAKEKVLKTGWDYVEEGKKYIPDLTSDKNLQDLFESLLVFMMERTK